MKKCVFIYLVIIIISINVFAEINLPNELDQDAYYFIFNKAGNYYNVLLWDVEPETQSNNRLICNKYYNWNVNDPGWVYHESGRQIDLNDVNSIVLDSNFTIYNYGGSVFFMPRYPLRRVVAEMGILGMMTLPVVGMIPYLIMLLIGLVAFWKAWQFLLRQLRMH